MAFAGMCPYLKDARSCERTICECARFTFPDKISRRELLYGYCGHPTKWKSCTFKTIMDKFYERKYSSGDDGVAERAAENCKGKGKEKNASKNSSLRGEF